MAFLLKTFVAQAFYIPSESMEPQLQVGDRVVVSKLAYRLHDPNRGDIVVFDSPSGKVQEDDDALPVRIIEEIAQFAGLGQPDEDELIKRVVGLPGETVEGRDGVVYVNGRRLYEPYLEAGTVTSTFGPVTVPDDELFMMGDNREQSLDSRSFGTVSMDAVVGRAVVKAWPPAAASFL